VLNFFYKLTSAFIRVIVEQFEMQRINSSSFLLHIKNLKLLQKSNHPSDIQSNRDSYRDKNHRSIPPRRT